MQERSNLSHGVEVSSFCDAASLMFLHKVSRYKCQMMRVITTSRTFSSVGPYLAAGRNNSIAVSYQMAGMVTLLRSGNSAAADKTDLQLRRNRAS